MMGYRELVQEGFSEVSKTSILLNNASNCVVKVDHCYVRSFQECICQTQHRIDSIQLMCHQKLKDFELAQNHIRFGAKSLARDEWGIRPRPLW